MDKPVEYIEVYNSVMMRHIDSIFTDEIRENYYVSELVYLPNSEKWLIKLARKIDTTPNQKE